jgi:hypothetical protein
MSHGPFTWRQRKDLMRSRLLESVSDQKNSADSEPRLPLIKESRPFLLT